MGPFSSSTDTPWLQAGLQSFFKEVSAALGGSKCSRNAKLGSPVGAEASPPTVGSTPPSLHSL